MQELFNWTWVEAQVAKTAEVWNDSAASSTEVGPRYREDQQRKRERAYDNGLRSVERELKKAPRTKAERLHAQQRITTAFARFSTVALDLDEEAVQLLTNDFLPAGMKLARWARRFDADLSMSDIIQACRNAWTACGLQPLLGEQVGITPAILGYSLLYPHTDNYLDCADISSQEKFQSSERLRRRLCGQRLLAEDDREAAIWTLVALIERQYPRESYPQVFDCLLAIHKAQEASIAQLRRAGSLSDEAVLRTSFAKGGCSVLADACLAHGWLSEKESRFSFEWGVLLQLGDDLQDLREDIQRGSDTLFSRAVAGGRPLDDLVAQLLNFSAQVGARMDSLPHATAMLKKLMRMSWRSLIIGAVGELPEFFTPEFLEEMEPHSPFRFGFLRTRHERLTKRQGLNERLFDAFLETPEGDDDWLPPTECRQFLDFETYLEPDEGEVWGDSVMGSLAVTNS